MGRPKGGKNKKPTDATTALYSISLEVNGKKLESTGETIDAAVLALPKFFPKTTGKVIISRDGKSSRPFQLNVLKLRRLFFPGMSGKVQRVQLAKSYAFFA